LPSPPPLPGPELLPPAVPLPGPDPVPPVVPPVVPEVDIPCLVDPPTPKVVLKVRVPACAAAGQPLEYHICIENSSAAPAHHVLVRNPLPANACFVRATPVPTAKEPELLWALGTLPPCCCREIVLVLQPTGAGDLKNCARVQYEHGQCVVTRIAQAPPPPEGIPIVPPPGMKEKEIPKEKEKETPREKGQQPGAQLKLQVKAPAQAYVNAPVTYTIVLTNIGKGPATNTLIQCQLPDNTIFDNATQGGRFLSNQVAWLIGKLEAGAQRTVEVTYKATAPGKLCNHVVALADDNLEVKVKSCTEFKGASALLFKMVDTQDPVAVGEETSYTIEVINQGGVPATNVQVKAFIPAQLAPLRAKGPTDFQFAPGVPSGQTVLFQPLATLEIGKTARYDVFVKALQPGEVRFSAELTADQLKAGGKVREEESTTIFNAEAYLAPIPAWRRVWLASQRRWR
jgi:uncharacterized repeat protein (TIGR01451 family)